MSVQQGPLIVVSDDKQPALMATLGEAGLFKGIESTWAYAPRSCAQVHPAGVLAFARSGMDNGLEMLAGQIGGIRPYVPLLVIDPKAALPENALPFSRDGAGWARLLPRLRAALRVRILHATVLRRLSDQA